MSAKPVGRALLFTAATILLIISLQVVAASSDMPRAGGGRTARPSIGDPAAPLADSSHRHQRQPGEAVPAAAPPVPKDVYAFLPLLSRPSACNPNPEEKAIADLATGHPEQERETMSCHPILAQVARERAVDMATRDYFDHENPDGLGPNRLVEQAGYQLPDWYDQAADANNIESIAAGYTTPDDAWNGWLDSPGHRNHVLGESDFFADQTNYGVGYAFSAGSTYKHYWVFITAPPTVD